MSLEDKLAELITSIDTLTSTIARAASAQRQPQSTQPLLFKPVDTAEEPDSTPDADEGKPQAPAEPKRGPGRPRKEPPPSPSQTASQGSSATPKPSPSVQPALAAAATASTPATAPAADSGSPATTDEMYDELKGLVTQHSGANGRSATMALFAEYDVAVPASLKAENAAKLPEVVARFRKELS